MSPLDRFSYLSPLCVRNPPPRLRSSSASSTEFPATLYSFLASLPLLLRPPLDLVSNFSILVISSPNINFICCCILESPSFGISPFFCGTLLEDIIFFKTCTKIVSNKNNTSHTRVSHKFIGFSLEYPPYAFFHSNCLSLVLEIT